MMDPTPASTTASPAPGRRLTLVWQGLGGLAAVAMLLLVFSFYTHPDFMVKLADKVWACF